MHFAATSGPRVLPPDTPWTTDYLKGAVYQLEQPVFVLRGSIRHLPELYVLPVGAADVPASVEQYAQEGRKKWPAIVGVAPPGTLLRYRSLIIQESTVGTVGHPVFQFVPGSLPAPLHGRIDPGEKVNLTWISAELKSGGGTLVDHRYLSRVPASAE